MVRVVLFKNSGDIPNWNRVHHLAVLVLYASIHVVSLDAISGVKSCDSVSVLRVEATVEATC